MIGTLPMSDDFDRKKYHLDIIREAAAELGGVRHPGVILESFLMSAQGGIGALGGFAVLTDRTSEALHLIVRDVGNIASEQIKVLIREASDHICAQKDRLPFFIIQKSSLLMFQECTLVLACPIEDNRFAFLGLASAMHGKSYTPDDRQLVISLASIFQISLNFALFSTHVELLNAKLQKQNSELDRQVFHLNGLKELSMEAGESVDVDRFLSAFLPTLLGRFSRHQGLVVLHDRKTGTVWLKSMGIEPKPAISRSTNKSVTTFLENQKVLDEEKESETSFLQVDQLLFLCLAGVENKHIQPLQVEPVVQMGPLLPMIKGFMPESAFLFLVKEQMYGALLLGAALEQQRVSGQEKELLAAFVAQSVLHLKNADSFATIVALNENLAQQNRALKKTIDELTQAEDRISVLEASARRVVQMINHNTERIMQVRLLDFVLIIGISIAIGTIFNMQNPRGISFIPLSRPYGVKSVSISESQKLLSQEGALLIDARPRELYELSHAKDSVNVPPSLFDATYTSLFSNEDLERPLVIYGKTFSRLYDEDVARKFFNRDHEQIYLLENGMAGLALPVIKGDK